jgi:hypothetical protein
MLTEIYTRTGQAIPDRPVVILEIAKYSVHQSMAGALLGPSSVSLGSGWVLAKDVYAQ